MCFVNDGVQKKIAPLTNAVAAGIAHLWIKKTGKMKSKNTSDVLYFHITMKEEFTLNLADRTYILKRVDHPEMAPAYQVQFQHRDQPLQFQMTRQNDRWVRLPQSLPYYVNIDGCLLAAAIEENELEG